MPKLSSTEHNNVASAPIQRTTHLERIELVATKISTNPRSIFSFKIQDVGWYHNHRSELSLTQHDMFPNNSKQERRMFLIILHVCGIFGTSDKNTNNNNTPTVLEIKKQQIPPRQLAFINEINFGSLLYLFYRKDKCSWKPTTISYLFVVSLFVSGH